MDKDKQLWTDAYGIAIVGASNPRGVARTLTSHIDAGYRLDNPALRAIWGHLGFLLGGSLGPESEDLDAVRTSPHNV